MPFRQNNARKKRKQHTLDVEPTLKRALDEKDAYGVEDLHSSEYTVTA